MKSGVSAPEVTPAKQETNKRSAPKPNYMLVAPCSICGKPDPVTVGPGNMFICKVCGQKDR